ncbi:MAG: cysteine desulfurase [Lachnospiraceae bacterium]|nr:cysteine desulfurase [Lachnospiraceae bacterium]
MEKAEIYLDNSATTRVYPEVSNLMCKIMLDDYGNPSSMHTKGVEAEKYVLDAYKEIAEVLKVKEKEIVFTSGGTESDNLALIGAAMANKRAGMHIITTKVEHPAILNTVAYLKDEGFEIDYLSVDKYGRISIDELKEKLRKDTIIVSIMHTNNEVGSLMPLEEAGKLIKSVNPSCLFHVDAVQGFGKAVMPIKSANIDMLSFSGHKIHGPKGIGVLYVNEKVKIKPISYGGGQQKGLRNGTLNVPGIAGIGLAAKMINENLSEKREKLYELKSFFLQEISKVDKVSVNGCKQDASGEFLVKETAPHIINISVKGLRSEVMLHALEEKGIYVSAGSACSSHSKKESSTLKAMGASAEETDGALRISMSEFTTKEELETLIVELKAVIEKYGRFIRK